MSKYSQQEKQQIIMDHYSNPKNNGKLENPTKHIHYKSTTCVDEVNLYLDEQKKISHITIGCAIFKSIIDILSIKIMKNPKNSKILIDNFYNLIHSKNYNEKILEELIIFENIHKFLNRRNCALSAINAYKKLFNIN